MQAYLKFNIIPVAEAWGENEWRRRMITEPISPSWISLIAVNSNRGLNINIRNNFSKNLLNFLYTFLFVAILSFIFYEYSFVHSFFGVFTIS